MQLKNIIKDNIFGLKPYISGKPIEEVRRLLGIKKVIKLASNENPLGPSPKAVAAVKNSLKEINRYPDGSGFYLKNAIADYFKVNAGNIILGNGSDEIIDIIIKTFLKNCECVLSSETTFLEYEIITKANGGNIKNIPLKKDFSYDLKGIKKAITAKTKIIFISNPNNPTGTYLNKNEINDFIEGIPAHVIVVFDEAYNEFVDAKDFPDLLSYFRKNKNVIILRTFSKAYGLAGLRIGFGIAKKDFVSFMERVRQPFNTNLLAQRAAIAALSDRPFLKKTQKVIKDGKTYLYNELRNLGIGFIPSQANFVLMKIKSAVSVVNTMLKKGVIVRDMQQYGLNDFLRVSIGTQEENMRFIKVLKEVLKGRIK